MLTSLAVILVGLWMVISSQSNVSDTFTLILGIVAAVLAFIDMTQPYVRK